MSPAVASFTRLPAPHNAVRYAIEQAGSVGLFRVIYSGPTEALIAAEVVEPVMLTGARTRSRGIDSRGRRYFRHTYNGRTQIWRLAFGPEEFRALPWMSAVAFPEGFNTAPRPPVSQPEWASPAGGPFVPTPAPAQQRTTAKKIPPYLRLVVDNVVRP